MKMSIFRWAPRDLLAVATAAFVVAAPPLDAALVTEPGVAASGGEAAAGDTVVPQAEVLEVVGDRVNVRARPGLRYEITCQVLRGDRVTAVGEQEGWREILAPAGSTVWIHGAFVRDGAVIGDRVNLRAGPSLSYSVVGRVTRGTRVEARSEYNEWVEILPPEGVTFWVSNEFLQPVASRDTTVIPTFTPPDEPGVEKVTLPGPIVLPAETTVEPETQRPEEDVAPPQEVMIPEPGEETTPLEEAAVPAPDEGVPSAGPAETTVEAGDAAVLIPPVGAGSAPLVLPESEIEWLAPPKDVAQVGEIHRTGFLVRRPGSHKLIQRAGRRAHLVAYLRSDEVQLDEFLGRNCRVVGAEQWAKGWPRPVIHVRQVSIIR